MIAMVAAIDRQRVIGNQNRLPWRLPADLKHFQELTQGHTVVMGHKTMESIGRPLPGRINLVLTRSKSQPPEGFNFIHTVEQVFDIAQNRTVFIIGGESVYRLFLPYAEFIYLTIIDHYFHGDAFFPELDPREWFVVSEQSGTADQDNPYPFVVRLYRHM